MPINTRAAALFNASSVTSSRSMAASLAKSNEQMVAELDALLRVGWRGTVFIVDDNFIGNKRNVKRLIPVLADWSERHGARSLLLPKPA